MNKGVFGVFSKVFKKVSLFDIFLKMMYLVYSILLLLLKKVIYLTKMSLK
nr:MAG TPA: hypothetical protein [Bacteriophage sp.]